MLKKFLLIFGGLMIVAVFGILFYVKPEAIITLFNFKKKPVEINQSDIIGDPRDFHQGDSKKIIFDDLNCKDYYYKKDGFVYVYDGCMGWGGWSESTKKLKNSDVDTFEIIDANYAKDKNNVYGKFDTRLRIADTAIPGADPTTFIPLSWPYAKDVNHVYYDLIKVLNDANPNTFEILGYNFIKDDKRVWYKDMVIEGADSESFHILSGGYAKDKKSVYYLSKRFNGANPDTFKVIDNFYTKDDDRVWYNKKEIFADSASFEILSKDYYAKDINSVYYQGKPLADIDPSTFEFLSYGYTKDSNSILYKNKPLGNNTFKDVPPPDVKSFETLSRYGCAKDINNYYRNGYVTDSSNCE